jgi:hypothetical protein
MGSNREALIAGYSPETNPTKKQNVIPTKIHSQGIMKLPPRIRDTKFPTRIPSIIPSIPPI